MGERSFDATHVRALKRYASAIDHVAADLHGSAEHPFWELADRVARRVAGQPVEFTTREAEALSDAGDRLLRECEISLAHGEALSAETLQRAEGWREVAESLLAVAGAMRDSTASGAGAAVSAGGEG